MNDLAEAIRARLQLEGDHESMSGKSFALIGPEEAQAALLAVLDLHGPDSEKWPMCVECSCKGALAATDCHHTVNWPCPTVRLIAEKLGVET